MTVHELVTAAQSLPFEQRKALIKALFEQLPKTAPLAGSITQIGDLGAASLHIRKLVSHSMQRSAAELRDSEAEQ
jgi:hypothetical protein